MPISTTNEYNLKTNLPFKRNRHAAEDSKDSPDTNKANEEESSKKRKKALLALGALGIAAIAIGTHHFVKINKHSNGNYTNKLTQDAKNSLRDFKEKLKGSDATEDIKNILANGDSALKFEAIKEILDNGKQHVNKNTWETIFNSVTTIATEEKIPEKHIIGYTNKLLRIMYEKELYTPKVLDEIITNTGNMNDDLKINIFHNLVDGFMHGDKYIQLQFSKEQAKKVLNILKGVKGNEFSYQISTYGVGISTKLSADGVKYAYSKEYLKGCAFDKNYMTEFNNIVKENNLPDDLILQLMDDIKYNLSSEMYSPNKENAINISKELLQLMAKNKANDFYKPNQFIHIVNDKFDLGYTLYRNISSFNARNIVSTQEQLEFNKMLKQLLKNTKIKDNSYMVQKERFIYYQELLLKVKNFKELFVNKDKVDFVEEVSNRLIQDTNAKGRNTLDYLQDFVNEMLEGFQSAKKIYNTHSTKDGYNLYELEEPFENFDKVIGEYLRKLKTSVKNDKEKSSKVKDFAEKIEAQIEKFGRENFKCNEYYESKQRNRDFNRNWDEFTYNQNNNKKTKIEQTKTKIIEFLNKNTDKDIIETLQNQELNSDTFKTIKRTVLKKYHPDKIQAKTEEEAREANARCQEILGLFEVLEKLLK